MNSCISVTHKTNTAVVNIKDTDSLRDIVECFVFYTALVWEEKSSGPHTVWF